MTEAYCNHAGRHTHPQDARSPFSFVLTSYHPAFLWRALARRMRVLSPITVYAAKVRQVRLEALRHLSPHDQWCPMLWMRQLDLHGSKHQPIGPRGSDLPLCSPRRYPHSCRPHTSPLCDRRHTYRRHTCRRRRLGDRGAERAASADASVPSPGKVDEGHFSAARSAGSRRRRLERRETADDAHSVRAA